MKEFAVFLVLMTPISEDEATRYYAAEVVDMKICQKIAKVLNQVVEINDLNNEGKWMCESHDSL